MILLARAILPLLLLFSLPVAVSAFQEYLDDDAVELEPGLELLYFRILYSGIYSANSDSKATFVVGEYRNNTNEVLDAPGLSFVLEDDEGNIAGEIEADPILQVILPGETMPFESAIFGDEPEPDDWSTAHVELCIQWGSTDRLDDFDPRGLVIRDSEEESTDDALNIEGWVYNGTDDPVANVYVKAAIYDDSGYFAGWTWTTVDVEIPPSKSARFVLSASGDPSDPIGVAGPGYDYDLWVGPDSPWGTC